MSNRDPLGHYAALGLGPGANEIEIGMAYRSRKRAYQDHRKNYDIGAIQAAYETLRDPETRRLYEEGKLRRDGRPTAGSRLPGNSQMRLALGAGIAVIALLAMVFFFYGSTIRATFVRFEPGDSLVETSSGRELGRVVAFTDGHRFENGVHLPAYRIDSNLEGEKWFPARDLERHYSKR